MTKTKTRSKNSSSVVTLEPVRGPARSRAAAYDVASVTTHTVARHAHDRGAPRARPLAVWHPFTQQLGWAAEDAPIIASADGLHADRHRRPGVPRRRLVAVVHRARPPAPGDRRGGARAARRGRALDHVGVVAPAGDRAGGAAAGGGAARGPRADARLLQRQRLDGQRDRAEDGVPVVEDPRRGAADQVRVLGHELPRGHDRQRVGRRDRPVPLDVPAAAVRRDPGDARRCRWPCARVRRARRRDRRDHPGAAGPGRGGDAAWRPTATCARSGSCATSTGS